MEIFKRIKTPVEQQRVAMLLASHILKIQSLIADFLNNRTKHLSGKVLVIALLLCSVLIGGYCLYLVLAPFL